MEQKKYSGYFCNKCNYIPLIKIIHKNNEIKVFSSCKCKKQYQNIESFLKNKYTKDIAYLDQIIKESPNNIHNQLNFEKSTLEKIIERFNEKKLKIIKEGINIKNQLIDILKRKIEEVNQLYNKYSEKNNKIILILEQLIQSYELIKDNKSNILNILNNCQIKENPAINSFQQYKDLENLFKNIEDYFKNKYIISNLDINLSSEEISSYYSPKKIKNLIELDNDLCAYYTEMSNKISIIDFKKSEMETYTLAAHNNYIEYIIKSNLNNIISYGDNKLIKIWPFIDRKYINEIRGKNLNIGDNKQNNFKEKEIAIYLNPIFTYNLVSQKRFIKMINLKDNRFLMFFQFDFLLFKYNFNSIELIQKYEIRNKNIFDLIDASIIYKENSKIIALNDGINIFFFELDNFNFINNLAFTNMNTKLIQINSKEILITYGYCFNIIDLNNFNIKLTVKNSDKKLCLLNLDDGTFLLSTGVEVKRYFIKTMEELPILNKNYYEDNYDDELDFNNYNDDTIYYIYKLNSGKIIYFHNNGRFYISNRINLNNIQY